MFKLEGNHNKAKVFTDNLEDGAIGQIIELCNQPFSKGASIRIMPDAHQGAGCTIGTTMTIKDKVVPNLVGVDIGCGLEVAYVKANKDQINFDQLDSVIRERIPSGFSVHEKSKRHKYHNMIPYHEILAPISINRAKDSVGTLGGGNHFIEVNEVGEDVIAVVVHSGSRNLGKQIAEHYQERAYSELTDMTAEKRYLIKKLKREGRDHEIQEALSNIKKPKIRKDLAYLEGMSFVDYMHDMKIAQLYASLNRKAMLDIILTKMGWESHDTIETIHNYIDFDSMILRKGAISAKKDERVIIPINMRDGSLIALGKGNPDWNFSAPHGAGRLMSRSKAKASLSLKEFEREMNQVWSTSIGQSTLDESPMAYKPMSEIIKHTKDTIEIVNIIKPLYNFKAS